MDLNGSLIFLGRMPMLYLVLTQKALPEEPPTQGFNAGG